MGKCKKMMKKIIHLMLAVMLCIDCFAAVVSDNDGSAFITKSEFEALKKDFAGQIQQYNTSIDGKIDGAISAYLAGINLSKEPTVLFDSLKSAQGGVVHFWNEVPYTGTDTIIPEINFSMTRHYTVKMVTNVVDQPSIQLQASGRMQMYSQIGVTNITTDGHRYTNTDNGGWHDKGSQAYISLPGLNWPSTPTWSNYNPSYENNQKRNYRWVINRNQDGSGSAWVYHIQPDGSKVLRHYALSYYPLQTIVAWAHTYNDKSGIANALNDAKYGDSTSISKLTVTAPTNWDTTTSGTKQGDGSEINGNYWEQTVRIVSTNTTRDYSVIMLGKNSEANVYALIDSATFITGTKNTETVSDQSFNSVYYKVAGIMGTNNVSGFSVDYTPITFNTESHVFNEFANQYATPLAGETVYLGSGLPICTANDEGTIKIKAKLKILSEDLSTSYPNKKLYYKFSNKKFVNNNVDVASGGKELSSGDVTTGADGSVTLEVNVDVNSKDYVWFTTYAEDAHRIVSVESCEAKML